MNLKLRISAGDLSEFDDNNDSTEAPRLEANYRRLGPSIITEGAKIGKSSDFWHRYKEDIQRAKDIGEPFSCFNEFIYGHDLLQPQT